MIIKPIHTNQDYEDTLSRINILMDTPVGSKAGDELEILSTLIKVYEDKNFPFEEPEPIEAIRFRMEQLNFENKDLAKVLNSGRGRVAEILNKKRPLMLKMIRSLQKHMNIPSKVLIQEYVLNKGKMDT